MSMATTYTDDFKEKMVPLFNAGKTISELSRDYGMSKSALSKWVKYYNASGSFREADNRSAEETELIRLEKENRQLRMENDLLKQAALILGRR